MITHTLLFIMQARGALETGVQGDVQLHDRYEIVEWTLLADQNGSIVVDIWKDDFASYPPTDADSITGASPPTISSNDAATSDVLTGWTTLIEPGETLRYNVDSVSAIERCTV